MEYLVVTAIALTLVLVVHASFEAGVVWKALCVLVLAFAARLVVHVFAMRSGAMGYGGDNLAYEARALEVVEYWRQHGFRFVTSEQLPGLYSAAVPCNLFAVFVYICGGPAPLACTAMVSLVACGLPIVMYRFAMLIGTDERSAFRLLVVTAFIPAFLLHTSDMFKDGFNAFLVVACLALGASNVRRFDVRKLLLLGPLLWALWYIRPYMVFMCGLPLILGVVKLKRALFLCGLAFLVTTLASGVVLPGMWLESTPIAEMQEQLERGQSETFRRGNAQGGSGVLFEDGGSAWGALLPKLFYTVFSPFPWMDGSMVLQLAKVETLLWYYLLYCAVRGARRCDRRGLGVGRGRASVDDRDRWADGGAGTARVRPPPADHDLVRGAGPAVPARPVTDARPGHRAAGPSGHPLRPRHRPANGRGRPPAQPAAGPAHRALTLTFAPTFTWERAGRLGRSVGAPARALRRPCGAVSAAVSARRRAGVSADRDGECHHRFRDRGPDGERQAHHDEDHRFLHRRRPGQAPLAGRRRAGPAGAAEGRPGDRRLRFHRGAAARARRAG
ncbi:hypothetical protein [Streptosporangium sp. NPDC048865]|uniref:hypothetical protein n=1 Tax=Streptosporangium sp. NPDC048865 TaxID=3155766 RepID=UPI00342F8681